MNTLIIPCQACGKKNRIPAVKQHLGPRCGSCKARLDIGSQAVPLELNDQLLTTLVSQAQLPVLVDFYSPTCGPCRQLAPVISKLARSYLGRVIIAKIDTNANTDAARRFQIRGVPTLLLFKNGQVLDQQVGAVPETALRQLLDTHL